MAKPQLNSSILVSHCSTVYDSGLCCIVFLFSNISTHPTGGEPGFCQPLQEFSSTFNKKIKKGEKKEQKEDNDKINILIMASVADSPDVINGPMTSPTHGYVLSQKTAVNFNPQAEDCYFYFYSACMKVSRGMALFWRVRCETCPQK